METEKKQTVHTNVKWKILAATAVFLTLILAFPGYCQEKKRIIRVVPDFEITGDFIRKREEKDHPGGSILHGRLSYDGCRWSAQRLRL